MKRHRLKFLLGLAAVFCAVALTTFSGAALRENGEFFVQGDWDKITYENEEFVRVDAPDSRIYGRDELLITPYFEEGDFRFDSDSATRYPSLYATALSDVLIRIDYTTDTGRSGALYFADAANKEQVESFLRREEQNEIAVSFWSPYESVSVSARQLDEILAPENRVPYDRIPNKSTELVAEAQSFGLAREYGTILSSREEETDRRDYYLISYDEYEASYFSSPQDRTGFLGLQQDGLDIHAWHITDESLCAAFDEMIETQYRWGDDGVRSPFDTGMSTAFVRGMGAVLFGFIPLAVAVFALLFWQKRKESRPYLGFALKGLAASQALVILFFILFAVCVF